MHYKIIVIPHETYLPIQSITPLEFNDRPIRSLLLSEEAFHAFLAFTDYLGNVATITDVTHTTFMKKIETILEQMPTLEGAAIRPYAEEGIRIFLEHTRHLLTSLDGETNKPGNLLALEAAVKKAYSAATDLDVIFIPTAQEDKYTLAGLSLHELNLQVYGNYVLHTLTTFNITIESFKRYMCDAPSTEPAFPLDTIIENATAILKEVEEFIPRLCLFGKHFTHIQIIRPDTPEMFKGDALTNFAVSIYNFSLSVFKRLSDFAKPARHLDESLAMSKRLGTICQRLHEVFPHVFTSANLADIFSEHVFFSGTQDASLEARKDLHSVEGYDVVCGLKNRLSDAPKSRNNLLKAELSLLRRLHESPERNEQLAVTCALLMRSPELDVPGKIDVLTVNADLHGTHVTNTCSELKVSLLSKKSTRDDIDQKEAAFFDTCILLTGELNHLLSLLANGPHPLTSLTHYQNDYMNAIRIFNSVCIFLFTKECRVVGSRGETMEGEFPRQFHHFLASNVLDSFFALNTRIVDSFEWEHIPEQMRRLDPHRQTENWYDRYHANIETLQRHFSTQKRPKVEAASAAAAAEPHDFPAQAARFKQMVAEETKAAKEKERQEKEEADRIRDTEIERLRHAEFEYDQRIEAQRLSELAVALPYGQAVVSVTPETLLNAGAHLMRTGHAQHAKEHFQRAAEMLRHIDGPDPVLICHIHLNLMELYFLPENRDTPYPHQEMKTYIQHIKSHYPHITNPTIKDAVMNSLQIITEGLALRLQRLDIEIARKTALLNEKEAEFSLFKAQHPEKFLPKDPHGTKERPTMSQKSMERWNLKREVKSLSRQKETVDGDKTAIEEIGQEKPTAAHSKHKPKKKPRR